MTPPKRSNAAAIRAFNERLDRLSEAARRAAQQAIAEEAEVALRDAQRNVPIGATGRLSRSLHVDIEPSGLTAFVAAGGKKAPHAHLVEFGHRTVKGTMVPGKPFLTPAGEAARARLEPRLAALIRAEVEK